MIFILLLDEIRDSVKSVDVFIALSSVEERVNESVVSTGDSKSLLAVLMSVKEIYLF